MIISSHSCGNIYSATMFVSVQFTRLEGSIEAAASRYTLQDRGNMAFQISNPHPTLLQTQHTETNYITLGERASSLVVRAPK